MDKMTSYMWFWEGKCISTAELQIVGPSPEQGF